MGYGSVAISKAEQIIQAIEEGVSLVDAAKLAQLNISTFGEVLAGVRDLAVRYARAREMRADVLVDEIIGIVDDPLRDPQQARNMVDARRWIASKHNSKVYGDRLDLNVQQTISIGEALAEARKRVLPAAPALPTLEAEVIKETPGERVEQRIADIFD